MDETQDLSTTTNDGVELRLVRRAVPKAGFDRWYVMDQDGNEQGSIPCSKGIDKARRFLMDEREILEERAAWRRKTAGRTT